MTRFVLTVGLVSALASGVLALTSGAAQGPPCDVDPTIQCLDVWDPVICTKPGEGRKVYSNACYAWRDCALVQTCRSYEA